MNATISSDSVTQQQQRFDNDESIFPGQWRLAEIQLANWGTFDKAIYRLTIARKGHLITGASGSGKSSLLDAVSTVLTPDKWLRFNEAAQTGGAQRDRRSVVSYLRGAWSQRIDDNEDKVVDDYLRTGTTWSAILLRYENEIDPPVTLCRCFFLSGTTIRPADVNDVCIIERSNVDLRDIEPFVLKGIAAKQIQRQWPNAKVTTNHKHKEFYARMRTLLGIGDETALRLLHKMQSAKSLESLDQIFRDYMLERPETFDMADTAVEQFGELRDAHSRVVELRKQRDHLLGLKEAADQFDQAAKQAADAAHLAQAVYSYKERRARNLAAQARDEVSTTMVELEVRIAQTQGDLQRAEEAYESARMREASLGGDRAARLREHMQNAKQRAAEIQRNNQSFADSLSEIGISDMPSNPAEFAQFMAQIDTLLAKGAASPQPSYEQHSALARARQRREDIEKQIDSLRRSRSTVPGSLLAVRTALAKEMKLPTSALPFAAELIEVREQYAAWTGAIERVLRHFALTLLVPSSYLPQVRSWVDGRVLNGTRLVYEEVRENDVRIGSVKNPDSLVHRIKVKDGPFASWVEARLSERCDYVCVDSPDALGEHARALTIHGQIKSSQTRYEKDDRHAIDDRSRWVLGNLDAKLESLTQQLQAARSVEDAAKKAVDTLQRKRDEEMGRLSVLRSLRRQVWDAIDVESAQQAVQSVELQLNAVLEEGGDFSRAAQETSLRQDERNCARDTLSELVKEHNKFEIRNDQLSDQIKAIDERITSGELPQVDEQTSQALDERFRRKRRHIELGELDAVHEQVRSALEHERDEALGRQTTFGNRVIELATRFNTTWPAASADLSPTINDRGHYIEILDEIVSRGLPDHETQFRTLLRERSRDLIGNLVNEILEAPRRIEHRVSPINDSLRRSPFDAHRYLQLRVKTRRSPIVTDFLAQLRSVSEKSWDDDSEQMAERRFATLEQIMHMFASSERAERIVREQCLDTRRHVTFLAEEIDEEGHVQATHDSGAAMSGGQQQKLAIFCLAAALRYQLADPDEESAKFGSVILDEAFDKADSQYTRMALDIFREFHFHMILATPHKLLQTFEPYIGGASEIENPTRQHSEISEVVWESHYRDKGAAETENNGGGLLL